MSADPTAKVRRNAARAQAATDALRAAIRSAHAEGVSLRSLAEAAGTSHEQIRRIVADPTSPERP